MSEVEEINDVKTVPLKPELYPNDDSIIVGGGFTTHNGTTWNRLVKLTSSGTTDVSFGYNSGFNGTVLTSLISSTSDIYLSGYFTTYFGLPCPDGLIKLKSDGTIDLTSLFQVKPLCVVNPPPTIIESSFNTWIVNTEPLNPVLPELKVVSIVPSVFNLQM